MLNVHFYFRIIILERYLRFKSGTVAFFAGYPTGRRINGTSFSGLSNILDRKFIGLGVWVKVTSPA
jgi:hypothetical protein